MLRSLAIHRYGHDSSRESTRGLSGGIASTLSPLSNSHLPISSLPPIIG